MIAKKKILFISYDGMTDPLGQSQVIPYLAGLTKYGYEFIILSCDKPDNYTKHKDYVLGLLAPYAIEWVSIPYHKNPRVLSTYYDVVMLKRNAAQLYKTKKIDMVHTRPGIPALVGLWLKKKYSIKFFNDIRGFWADERVDGGMFNMRSILFRKIYAWFKKKEYECLEIADYNTCITHKAKEEMLTWNHIKNKHLQIDVIPCSVDLDLFDPDKIDPVLKGQLKKELGISDHDFIISYLGSVGGWYLTDSMMQFCKQTSLKIPNAKFLFISPLEHSVIIDAANKHDLNPEKIIIRYGKRHEVPALLSFSRYSVFFIKKCYSKISSSPTKHGEIMAMGIPLITNAGVGDVKEIVEKYNSGFVLNELNLSEYNCCAAKLSTSHFDAQNIRKGAIEFYSLEKAIQSYRRAYNYVFDSV